MYFVTDHERTSVRQFFEDLFRAINVSLPTKSLPAPVAKVAASVVESIWRIAKLKGNPPLSRFELSFVMMPRRYSTLKAQSELKYNPVVSRKAGFESLRRQLGKSLSLFSGLTQ
ncbi:MAG: hypothetical protein IPK04_17190 [Bdellovibrionales bacterium]|nr:hypothetical protein [Bdellovibrionales bacterium]